MFYFGYLGLTAWRLGLGSLNLQMASLSARSLNISHDYIVPKEEVLMF
jgi:hypothetical protein